MSRCRNAAESRVASYWLECEAMDVYEADARGQWHKGLSLANLRLDQADFTPRQHRTGKMGGRDNEASALLEWSLEMNMNRLLEAGVAQINIAPLYLIIITMTIMLMMIFGFVKHENQKNLEKAASFKYHLP